MSARQVHRTDFVREASVGINRSGARGDQLKLEQTESVLPDEVEVTIVQMTELKAHGLAAGVRFRYRELEL